MGEGRKVEEEIDQLVQVADDTDPDETGAGRGDARALESGDRARPLGACDAVVLCGLCCLEYKSLERWSREAWKHGEGAICVVVPVTQSTLR